eukprot:Phypoly_transcript_08792.p1 GENE.Phypoly_transcript_08792~~Phypoly_transcript_08792.p1  ORF type:complete len:299 (+),score=48.36 Phypoly_transcript_08792:236-1132(+)
MDSNNANTITDTNINTITTTNVPSTANTDDPSSQNDFKLNTNNTIIGNTPANGDIFDNTPKNGNSLNDNPSPPRPNTAVAPALQGFTPNSTPGTPRSLTSPRMPSTPQTPTVSVTKPVIKKPLQQFSPYEALHFMCPLTGQLFEDPVIATDGYTYEREAIVRYLKHSKKSPVTRAELASQALIPNYTLLRQLQNIKPRLIHKRVSFFDLLPHWVLHEILSFLAAPCLVHISQVSKHFHKMANNTQLWTYHYKNLPKKPGPDPNLPPKELYKAIYKETHSNNKSKFSNISFHVQLVVSR